jgi:hypothetical protein
MKTIFKRLVKDEKGVSLVLVLILLLISGLIIGPLLSYMGTGLFTSEVYEMRTDELYAADAGVEDAILRIPDLNLCLYQSTSFTIPDINGKSVVVTVNCTREDEQGMAYHVKSIATGSGSGTVASISGTQIDAYIIGVSSDYSGLLDNIITSQNATDIHDNVVLDYTEGHGPVKYYDGPWPTAGDLTDWYWEDVEDAAHYNGDTEIDLDGNSCPAGPIYVNDEENDSWPSGLGPLYIKGELDILNSSNDEATLALDGTLYITGDTTIGKQGSGQKTLTLDLNGHTIFVTSDTTGPPYALWIGDKCTIEGPGVIIAVGDIYFEPKAQTGGEENPIFILSVEGETQIQPSGLFYGAIAGSVEVDVQPGHAPNIIYPLGGFGGYNLNFPGLIEPKQLVYSIASWQVTHLSPNDLGG